MATLKLDIPGLSGGGDDPTQQQPAAPPPPPPPLNFAQFASNPMAQQKVSAMIPGLPPPPPPQMAAAGPPPFTPPPAPSGPPTPPPAQFTPPSTPQQMPGQASAPGLPSLPAPTGQAAPDVSTPDQYFRYHPDQHATPMGDTLMSRILLAATAGLSGAAGGLKGDPLAGVRYAQQVQDYNNSVPQLNADRFAAAVTKPQQAALTMQDTRAQMQQRQSLANKADAQAEEYTPQVVTPEQATALGMPQLAGVTMNARDLANLSGRHDTNTTSAANATTRAGATTAAATTRAGATVDAATIRANAPGKGRAAAAGPVPTAGTPEFDATVKAIGEGRIPMPRYSSRTAAMVNAVNKAYPNLDATTFNTHQASEKNMTSGAAGQAINSFNTALQHLGRAEANVPNNSSVPIVNSVHNAFLRASGDPALSAFDADRTAVSAEIAKAYKGGVINKEEHDEYQGLLNPNASPAQMKASFGELKQLLSGKLESYNYQRQQGQPATQGGPIMSPGAASVMNGGYSNLHHNPQTGQTIGLKGGKWYDTKSNQAVQ